MSIVKEVSLDRFTPRDFQMKACDAFENKGFKKMILIWPRRSGKDIVAWNLVIRAAVRHIGVYMYCLPTFSQGRKVIFDSITNDSHRFTDYIPSELIKSINSSELKVNLVNGSIIQIIGSDSYNTSLVGTNPRMVVFSEFALADPDAYKFVLPIINGNGGSVLIVSTPRGKNTLYDIYEFAKDSPQWFCEKLSLDDTKHIPIEMIQKDIDEGQVSPDLVQQEYYCSFECGAAGSYYSKYIDQIRLRGQIGKFKWFPDHLVSTAWDLGAKDSTAIIWYQTIGPNIYIIDSYQKNKEGLAHYIDVIKSKPYRYDKHWAPHDIAVLELGSGLTRLEIARQLGLRFEVKEGGISSALPMNRVMDGIESVRTKLPMMWFDEDKCKELIKALENYRQEWDEKRKIYRDNPYHDSSSHFADAMRYLVASLSKSRDGMITSEQREELFRKARGINNYGLESYGGNLTNRKDWR